MNRVLVFFMLLLCGIYGCKSGGADDNSGKKAIVAPNCSSKLPKRFGEMPSKALTSKGSSTELGMVWIPNAEGHPGFWMDETEVTNAQFRNS